MSQMTFTEDEVKKMVDCYNFIFENTCLKQSLPLDEGMKLHSHVANWAKHIKTMNNHIMELKQVIEAEDK